MSVRDVAPANLIHNLPVQCFDDCAFISCIYRVDLESLRDLRHRPRRGRHHGREPQAFAAGGRSRPDALARPARRSAVPAPGPRHGETPLARASPPGARRAAQHRARCPACASIRPAASAASPWPSATCWADPGAAADAGAGEERRNWTYRRAHERRSLESIVRRPGGHRHRVLPVSSKSVASGAGRAGGGRAQGHPALAKLDLKSYLAQQHSGILARRRRAWKTSNWRDRRFAQDHLRYQRAAPPAAR